MNHLPKSDLIDQSWYSGVCQSSGTTSLGQWDALNNRFMVIKVTAWETYQIPMIYPGDENEYFLIFYPYDLETQEQRNG